jgi:hypothetical protein
VRPTATFCLSCDRPLADTDRGLSVAEGTPVRGAGPGKLIAVVAACLVVAGAATWATVAFLHARHTSENAQATADVRRAVTLLVSAEAGHGGACRALAGVTSGRAGTVIAECQTIVGRDTGVRLDSIDVSRPSLRGATGHVRFSATTTDASGTHATTEVVDLVRPHRDWQLVWSGHAL